MKLMIKMFISGEKDNDKLTVMTFARIQAIIEMLMGSEQAFTKSENFIILK